MPSARSILECSFLFLCAAALACAPASKLRRAPAPNEPEGAPFFAREVPGLRMAGPLCTPDRPPVTLAGGPFRGRRVWVRYVVHRDGSLSDVTFPGIEPDPALAEATRTWLAACPHRPGSIDEVPVPVVLERFFEFRVPSVFEAGVARARPDSRPEAPKECGHVRGLYERPKESEFSGKASAFITIDEKGHMRDPEIAAVSDERVLRAMLEWAQSCTWTPAIRDGVAVPVRFSYTYVEHIAVRPNRLDKY